MSLPIVAAVQPKKNAFLTLRLPGELKRELQQAAQRRRRSVNWLVQDLLERGLARDRRRGKK